MDMKREMLKGAAWGCGKATGGGMAGKAMKGMAEGVRAGFQKMRPNVFANMKKRSGFQGRGLGSISDKEAQVMKKGMRFSK